MNLQDELRLQSFPVQSLPHANHGLFHDICAGSLNRRIHGNTLAELSLHKVRARKLRNRPPSAHECHGISLFFGI